jgi:hypothetical protein
MQAQLGVLLRSSLLPLSIQRCIQFPAVCFTLLDHLYSVLCTPLPAAESSHLWAFAQHVLSKIVECPQHVREGISPLLCHGISHAICLLSLQIPDLALLRSLISLPLTSFFCNVLQITISTTIMSTASFSFNHVRV